MTNHPPLWLTALLSVPVLLGFALLWIGVSISRPFLRFEDIAAYSIPLVFTLVTGGFSWWMWTEGQTTTATIIAAVSPIVLLLVLVVALGVGI